MLDCTEKSRNKDTSSVNCYLVGTLLWLFNLEFCYHLIGLWNFPAFCFVRYSTTQKSNAHNHFGFFFFWIITLEYFICIMQLYYINTKWSRFTHLSALTWTVRHAVMGWINFLTFRWQKKSHRIYYCMLHFMLSEYSSFKSYIKCSCFAWLYFLVFLCWIIEKVNYRLFFPL